MSDAVHEVDAILDSLNDVDAPSDIADVGDRLLALVHSDKRARRRLLERLDELHGRMVVAKTQVAKVSARLGAACLLSYKPADEQPTPNLRLASERHGPAAEIALAALHLLRYAGDVVPLNTAEGPLEDTSDPDFADYQRVFAAAVEHLATAGYFLLDAVDARPALLSSPPEQETFPPLPFRRVWAEMSHMTPLVRLTGDGSEQYETLDLLGIGIGEVEQGRVWDVYLPFQFGASPEFFFLAGRIAPNAVVSADDELAYGAETFAAIREIAVGAAHLITARNATPEPVLLPRQQRKQMPPRPDGQPLRLYYVDLHAAGEHGGGGSSREYTVRWLVRGHWRHIDSGRTFCTCCDPPQIASWVAPYIKGPPGAPWKGKQVRRPP